MFVYYGENDVVTSTMICSPSLAPAGPRRIEVPDDTPVHIGRDLVIDEEHVPVSMTAEEILHEERAGMVCSPLQGSLVLGETLWSQVETMLADPQTPFAMRRSINSATVWERLSPMMDEMAYLMNLTPYEVDDLFRAAMLVKT